MATYQDVLAKADALKETVERREKPSGRYKYDRAVMCKCGHRFGDHLADAKASEAECVKCECQGFRKA